MSEFLDGIIQQVDRVGCIDARPTRLLVFFNEGCENVELVARVGPGRRAPEFLDLPNSRGVIVVISNRVNFHVATS